MAKCSGGLRTFLCFGYFLKMEALNDKLQCNIAQWQLIIMYITYGKVFRGTPNIFMFWLFPESTGNHQKTPSDLPAIALNDKLQCNIAQWQLIIMYMYV